MLPLLDRLDRRYSDYEDRPNGYDDDYIKRNLNIMLDTCL